MVHLHKTLIHSRFIRAMLYTLFVSRSLRNPSLVVRLCLVKAPQFFVCNQDIFEIYQCEQRSNGHSYLFLPRKNKFGGATRLPQKVCTQQQGSFQWPLM